MRSSWAFESLLARLPEGRILALELGKPSGLVFPSEAGRVSLVAPGQASQESTKIAYVEGDIAHVPTVLNAASFALDLFGDWPMLLLSDGGLDDLSPADVHELCELLILNPGPCIAAVLKTRHELSWRFSEDPEATGLVSMIRDYRPQDQGRPETWWLYVRPEDANDQGQGRD